MAQNPVKERVKFDTDPVTRRALRLRAVIDDVEIQEVVNAALKKYLAKEIDEVLQRGLVSEQSVEKEPRKRKRESQQET